jgi:hypothetical protein
VAVDRALTHPDHHPDHRHHHHSAEHACDDRPRRYTEAKERHAQADDEDNESADEQVRSAHVPT